MIRVERRDDDVEPLIGGLFRRVFGSPPPDYPIHFVAFLEGERELPVGYCHFTALEDCYLGGGMCFDERSYRRLSREDRRSIREAGGVARFMLAAAVSQLTDKWAVFGYVGDTRAERIDLSVGFEHTGHPRLIVRWNREDLSPEQKRGLINRVAAIGPF